MLEHPPFDIAARRVFLTHETLWALGNFVHLASFTTGATESMEDLNLNSTLGQASGTATATAEVAI